MRTSSVCLVKINEFQRFFFHFHFHTRPKGCCMCKSNAVDLNFRCVLILHFECISWAKHIAMKWIIVCRFCKQIFNFCAGKSTSLTMQLLISFSPVGTSKTTRWLIHFLRQHVFCNIKFGFLTLHTLTLAGAHQCDKLFVFWGENMWLSYVLIQ